MEKTIKRGDIYYAELNPVIGSEQGGTRPVLIISNDIGNRHSHGYRCRYHEPSTHKGKAAHPYCYQRF